MTKMYFNIKSILEEHEYVPVCLSRRFGEWRVLFMDNSGCPFTLDYFYAIKLGFCGGDLEVAVIWGLDNLTEYEVSKLPKERIEAIARVDKALQKEGMQYEYAV